MSSDELHCKGFDFATETSAMGKRIKKRVFCPHRWHCRRFQAHMEDMFKSAIMPYFNAGECMFYDYRQLKKTQENDANV